MIKVLIVDDNKNNRMILDLLMEEYMEKHPDISLKVHEVEDGLKALNAVEASIDEKMPYNLIFMDIMMPVMDGIEATRKIHQLDKNIMVIAVSAVDDVEKQKEILDAGAEDYVPKPINGDIFFNRLSNYVKLINLRREKTLNKRETYNPYTHAVYNRQLVFTIDSEAALSEFWEYYLLDSHQKYESLSDVVRALFALGTLQIRMKITSKIVVEESESMLYFTLTKMSAMQKFIKLVMAKNSEVGIYKYENDVISFAIDKEVKEQSTIKSAQSAVVQTAPQEIKESVESTDVSIEVEGSKELEIFDYMDPEDLDELEDYLNQLNSLLLVVGNGNLESYDVQEIITLLRNAAKIMTIYHESYMIAQGLNKLSDSIEANQDKFMELSADIGELSAAFSADLQNWLKQTFHTGAPSVNFLDDTILSNVDMICAMISDDEGDEDEDFDDIFDF